MIDSHTEVTLSRPAGRLFLLQNKLKDVPDGTIRPSTLATNDGRLARPSIRCGRRVPVLCRMLWSRLNMKRVARLFRLIKVYQSLAIENGRENDRGKCRFAQLRPISEVSAYPSGEI